MELVPYIFPSSKIRLCRYVQDSVDDSLRKVVAEGEKARPFHQQTFTAAVLTAMRTTRTVQIAVSYENWRGVSELRAHSGWDPSAE